MFFLSLSVGSAALREIVFLSDDGAKRSPHFSLLQLHHYRAKDNPFFRWARAPHRDHHRKTIPVGPGGSYSGGSIRKEWVMRAFSEAMAPQYFFSESSMAWLTPAGRISVP